MKFVIFVFLTGFYLPVFSADDTNTQIQASPKAETETKTSSNDADNSKPSLKIILPAPLAPKDTGFGVASY